MSCVSIIDDYSPVVSALNTTVPKLVKIIMPVDRTTSTTLVETISFEQPDNKQVPGILLVFENKPND